MALRGCMANVVTLLGAKWRREKTRCPYVGSEQRYAHFFGRWAEGRPHPPLFCAKAPIIYSSLILPHLRKENTPPTVCQGPRRKNPYGFPLWNAQKRKKKNVPLKKDEESLPIPHSPIIHYFGWPRWLPLSWEKPASRTAHNSLFLLCAAPLSFFSEASAAQKRHFLH